MISVVIPLYNKERIIERSLRSVLTQGYDDYEVVIVDDGSTDNSLKICKHELLRIYREFAISKENVKIIIQENGGPSKARNTGVRHAKGEWIVFLDADDELLPTALSTFVHYRDVFPDADFIASPFYNKTEQEKCLMCQYKGGYVNNPFKEHFFGKFLPRTGAFACKKELLLNNPFNEQIRRFEDLEVLFRIYKTARIVLTPIPTMIVNTAFAAASHGRKDIKEDFVGHICFKGKSFWEKMCLYQFYLGERPYYLEQCKSLYPGLDKRYDLLLLSKLLSL